MTVTWLAFMIEALEGFRALPGVESIAVTDHPPQSLIAEGRTALSPIDIASGSGVEGRASAIVSKVSPGYF